MKRGERAQQLWSLFALAATSRQSLAYDMVARLIGSVRPSISDFLGPIQQLCAERSIPQLSCLIVSKDIGVPWQGFIAAQDLPTAQVRVFKYSWLRARANSGRVHLCVLACSWSAILERALTPRH